MNLRWRLSHAQGYFELGALDEAWAELDALDADNAARVEVLGLRALILQEKHDWPAMQKIAAELARREPHEAGWWVMWAYATRRAQSLADAEAILRQAETLHPDEATIQFNLGCYACQQGQLSIARIRVDRAIALDAKFRSAAETDPDLAPLRATPPGSPSGV